MKMFISWSGNRSYALAEALYEWLPSMIQALTPWISSDIQKGSRWSAEVEAGLRESRFGLICLTKDNLESPWLLFEAGAISNAIEKTYVCPYLLDVEYDDLPGPLKQFQVTKAEKGETRRLIHSINRALGPNTLSERTIDRTFDQLWPTLERSIKDIPSHPNKKTSNQVILNDAKTMQLTRMHQASIAFRISTVIDNTLHLVETDIHAFDSDDFHKAIYGAILEGRDLCVGFENQKIGDLTAFFEKNFPEVELRTITLGIESILLNPHIKPIAKRTMLFRKIRAIEEEVFARSRVAMGEASEI